MLSSPPISKPSQMIRVFLALPVPRETIGRLQVLQRKLNTPLDGMSWSRPDALHLTIRFFGNVPGERLAELKKAIQEICASQPPFLISAMNVSAFEERVIWVGIGGAIQRLRELVARINDGTRGFGDHEEEREFRPHLTIGRVKRRRGSNISVLEKLVGYSEAEFGEWMVDHLELMRSDLSPQGANDTCMETIPLTGIVVRTG